MAEIKKCAACGCTCGSEEEAPEVESVETTSSDEQPQMKSFKLYRHSSDTEFAVLLALVPAMTMTLFNLMGLI